MGKLYCHPLPEHVVTQWL